MYTAPRTSTSGANTKISVVSYPILRQPNAIRLGRLLVDIYDPTLDYVDIFTDDDLNSTHATGPAIDIIQSESIHPLLIVEGGKKNSIGVMLAEFLGSRRTSSASTKLEIVSEKAIFRELALPGQHFNEGCKDPKVQLWLTAKAIARRSQVYMIVGYHTLVDPILEEKATRDNTTIAGINPGALVAHTSMVMGAAGVLPSSILDLNYGEQHGLSLKQKLHAPGERIWAVKYAKITLRTWLMQRLPTGKMALGITRWEIMWPTVRGQSQETKGVLEADLEELSGEMEEMEEIFGEEGADYEIHQQSSASGQEHQFVVSSDSDIDD